MPNNHWQVVGRVFRASEFKLALEHKEETGGILLRREHPVHGVVYEVVYIPKDRSPYKDI